MSDWKKHYEDHLVTLPEAAKAIKSGDTLYLGSTLCIPYALVDALADRHEELENVTLIGNMFLAPTKIMMDPSYKKSFHTISMFGNKLERMAQAKNNIDYGIAAYVDLVRSMTEVYKPNVVAVEVCPPDENGFCNTGLLGTNFTPDIIRNECVKTRIAVINKFQPPANGDEALVKYPLDMFDYIVECHHDIPSLPYAEPTEIDKKLAEFIMPYINDGDRIQIGIGGLSNEIAKSLHAKKNIEIFTEIGTDAMIDLVECGVVKSITMGGALGGKELYEWLSKRDDVVKLVDSKYTIEPAELINVDNFVAINNALQIDVTGQACCEAQGVKMYSGIGGSFSFLYTVPKCKNGRSFLCLRSTYTDSKGVTHSNIHAAMPAGSIVTIPRYLPQYIVTEYGVADVYLKSVKDRINAIIPIAHPDYREQLKKEVVALGYMGEEDLTC